MNEDFELWARTCVKIRHKLTGRMVPFELNSAQRKVLAVMERQRRAGLPIRVIVLKARQWGCSTLVSLFMAWIQLYHAENWHSLVCAHVKDAAAIIRSNYGQLLANYPPEHLPEGVALVPYEGTRSVRLLAGRGCRITTCTAESVDSARGADYSMAHLSEVAFWPDTPGKRAGDLVRAICGSISRVPLSLVVMESTANGVGNFFHQEWTRAVSGQSDKTPVFVAWHEIEIYREPLLCKWATLRKRLSDYELDLVKRFRLKHEQINWYHNMLLSMGSAERMKAEYPSDATEAFVAGGSPVFSPADVERLRQNVMEPKWHFEVVQGKLIANPTGEIAVWDQPQTQVHGRAAYVVAVDVGGRWAGADWSVISVFDCSRESEMELVAEWRGHRDHDVLCDMAVAVARHYCNALLVVESNTLESHSLGVLERMAAGGYRNIYRRVSYDSADGHVEYRYGFHTNVATKAAAIGDLTVLLRDGGFVEREAAAVEELATYSRQPNGSMAAPVGMHDDMVMTRAIAAYARRQLKAHARRSCNFSDEP